MKIILLISFISTTKGSSLWSVPAFKTSDLNFLVDRDNSSVHVKGFVKDAAIFHQDHTRNIKFFLFTRNEQQGIQLRINDTATLLNSGFDFNAKTKILIHGFANSLSSDFNKRLKYVYTEEHKHNVLVVDWSALCYPPFYPSAVDNARQVGVYTARLLGWLVTHGVELRHVHMLGHSIGAHIAGIAGHHLSYLGHVGRITGLDPAKPMFELESEEHRLSSDDADFVDCIHTCGGFLGLANPTCIADFYPNGGTNPQPGCTFDFLGRCSHQRAYEYFAESVTQPGSFSAVRCANMHSYSPTNCSADSVVTMGEHIDTKSHGIFYLATGSTPPFYLKESIVAPVSALTKFSWYFQL